jgi:salicylate hydroxylase
MARAAVAGAGIAGLAAAIALAQRGWSVALFERNDRIEDAGAGIQLSPNATAVLDRLGLMDSLLPSLFEPRAVALHDAPSGALLNHVPLGDVALAGATMRHMP